jgi:hypothetical protein
MRPLKWSDCVNVILNSGAGFDDDIRSMRCAFEIAKGYRGFLGADTICGMGYIICAFRGLIRPYAEGWFFLSDKGEALRRMRLPAP